MDTKKENVLTTSPNPSESPDSSHELAAVLREIARIDPAIKIELDYLEFVKTEFDDMAQDFDLPDGVSKYPTFPEKWLGDIVAGEIVRAVKSHRNPKNDLDDWMIDIDDGGDDHFVVYIKDRLGHKIAVGQGPLALAAAQKRVSHVGYIGDTAPQSDRRPVRPDAGYPGGGAIAR